MEKVPASMLDKGLFFSKTFGTDTNKILMGAYALDGDRIESEILKRRYDHGTIITPLLVFCYITRLPSTPSR